MHAGGFSRNDIDLCMAKHDSIVVTKTTKRSVLGSMNDYVVHLKHWIERYGGLSNCDLGVIAHQLNQIPQIKLDCFNAFEAFRQKQQDMDL